jgi:LysR family hydrogen peroxide-inducible transcriptional activator
MELNQLEYVVALEKYMSFSIASEEINISQSNLSYQIKKLEDELGVRIFTRTTRSVQLTPAGEEFVAFARRMLNEIDQIKARMLEYGNLKRGSIRVGAIPIITPLGITPVIARFQRTYPGIHVQLIEENSDLLVRRMMNQEIDVAFITSPFESQQQFDFYPVINDRLVLIVSPDNPLAKRRKVKLAELANEKFLMIKQSSALRDELIQACIKEGFRPNIIFESTHSETLTGLVEEGIGVAFFAERAARYIAKSARIKIVNLDTNIRRVTGLAVAHHNTPLSTNAFVRFVLEQFQPG